VEEVGLNGLIQFDGIITIWSREMIGMMAVSIQISLLSGCTGTY